jgi:predicted enzyme related to lactoylglutathione lyase
VDNSAAFRLHHRRSAARPEVAERLKAAGATVVQEPYQPGEEPDGWIATFSDPDDNYFQLIIPM